MRRWWLMMLVGLVGLGACRQPNPEWKGPSDSLGDETAGDVTDPTTSDPTAGDPTADGGSETTDLPTCDAPALLCGTSCINVQTDKRHCGDCDASCAPSEKCEDGECR